ncbi:MAG: dihydrofolate reductase [Calditrichaeota bacterium]|nr:MAG: dihydrofolate reductase [Calditrichota bacterium]
MKVTYYAASSLDGYIAREDGDVSWLDELEINMAETGYDEFFASIDGLVMGRSTYDFVFDYGSWPYGDKPTWVCTNRAIKAIEGSNLKIVKTPDEVIKEANSEELKHLWLVGGGKLASSFIKKGLLTNLSISEMPVNLNAGIPLFSDHQLKELSTGKIEMIQKKGFKQIEVALIDCKIK